MDKKELLIAVVDWYGGYCIFNDYPIISIVDCTNITHKYISLDLALKDWLSTMEESNNTHETEKLGKFYLWTEDEINYIKNL